MNARLGAWLIMVGIAALASGAYGQLASEFDRPGWWRVLLPAVMGASGLLMIFLAPSIRKFRQHVLIIWIPALLLRIMLLPTAPSDDVNRYLWEGKLVSYGISPYEQAADAEEWSTFRDRYWEGMNHKDKPTAYPPLSELAFAVIGFAAYHPMSYKLVFVLADLITLGAVLALLRRRGMSPGFAGFYAFNPMVLLSFAGEAHFDILMVAPLVWALWLYETGRTRWAVALASISSGIKWVTLPLLPFFAGRRLISGAAVALLVLILPALFFWESLPQLFSGLFQFGSTRSFNGPIYDLLRLGLGAPRSVSIAVVGGLFLIVLLWRWLLRKQSAMDTQIRWFLGALIVLSPTVHFWYLAWLMPFVALRPSLPWLSFSLTMGAYFFVWMNPQWGLRPWQQLVFWGPFFIGMVYELWSTRGRVLWPKRPVSGFGETVSVIIPTLNAANELPKALKSLEVQSACVDELIIVDAGSTDGTLDLAKEMQFPIRIVAAEKGRGQQIVAGIEAARSEWVAILHADCELEPDAVACLKAAVHSNPQMMGGAFGQRFKGGSAELTIIELLNDMRSLFSRTAFGDQVQFFHRTSALLYDFVPKQPLMEDVESSWRVRECGEFVFLGQPCSASRQKWNPEDWLTRFALVLRLVSRYRLARLQGRARASDLSLELYEEYYSPRK
ncbi:MAG: glycosyltransferase [Verrucomicrobiota bacterium]